ncbi:cytochrome P450 [Armillaria luteobubalina]|uniref:Cytochrome P450 n=1 Tax=Armillaria luteobubalina TaxID=153913 RepID=A0AA39Q9D6_9AGAR|nr:cytochrome P450 [Armillaria luteobubalina]
MDFFRAVDLSAFLALSYVLYRLFSRTRLRLPPGPRGLPILGNIYDIPEKHEWVTYRDMARRYDSDIIHLNLMGTCLIVVNTREAARELFDRRSAIYSDKPPFPMLNELMGFTWHFAFHRYGAYWKEHRKLFHKELAGPAVTLHYPRLLDGARCLLKRLLDEPNNFRESIRFMAARVILGVTYGIDVRDNDDYYVQTAEKAMAGMAVAGNAGSFLVDSFPILQCVPDWFPGADFKRKAANWNLSVKAMAHVPMKFVHDSMASGTSVDSIASKYIAEMEENAECSSEKEEILRNVLASSYAAGSDTTVSSLTTFILAMTQNPNIQKKAQEAIDEVIGCDRLPEFSDYKSVPYINAILKEVLRWRAVLPLAVPHSTSRDDEYRGYHIPKDAIVVGNAWAMMNDVSVYGENPDVFNPDRFLKDAKINPDIPHPNEAFGFGRRVCPGQDMAEASMWLTIASILAVFNITKAVDDKGNIIEPSGEFTSGMLSHAAPFECEIKPRSKYAVSLIQLGAHAF